MDEIRILQLIFISISLWSLYCVLKQICIAFLNVVAVLIFIKISIYMFFGKKYMYSHLDVEMAKCTEDMVILQVTGIVFIIVY